MTTFKTGSTKRTKLVQGEYGNRAYHVEIHARNNLPDDIVDSEQIEDIINMINDMGIEVHEVAPDTGTLIVPETAPAPEEDAEEAVAIGKPLKADKPLRAARAGVFHSQLAAKVAKASVLERVALEVDGVPVDLAKDLFDCMHLPLSDIYELVGMPRSTLHRRLATPDGTIDGLAGQTVVGYAELLNVLEGHLAEYVNADTASSTFNAAQWLGEWLREPNPALGGALPANLMHAPTGRAAVTRALGATFSGAYQ